MWLYERSVRELKTQKDVSGLLTLKNGSGSRSRTKGFEDEIIAEAERGNYHTRQQIADMIEDKFQVKVSVTAVARLLKKRRQETESRFFSGESGREKTAGIL